LDSRWIAKKTNQTKYIKKKNKNNIKKKKKKTKTNIQKQTKYKQNKQNI
jgi:hypothetical protein